MDQSLLLGRPNDMFISDQSKNATAISHTDMKMIHTVFDLISGLFAYVILGKQIRPIYRTPLHFFLRALCNLLYLLCTLSASIPGAKRYFRRSLHVREGRKSLFWHVYIIRDDRYNTILSALETITKTAMLSLS